MENKVEIIKIEQLPVIVERLKVVQQDIEEKADQALSLVCTEETVTAVKKARAELNKNFEHWETQRIAVKKAIMEPYNKFEEAFKEHISKVYEKADIQLKGKIDAVENELIEQKRAEAERYFNEYATLKDIDFLRFRGAGIKILKSVSDNKIKEQIREYIDKVADDVNAIVNMEYSAEIMAEYKLRLNLPQSISTVKNLHERIEIEKQRELERKKAKEEEVINQVRELREQLSAPTVVEDVSDIKPEEYEMSFKVKGTLEDMKKIKAFLLAENIHFEKI